MATIPRIEEEPTRFGNPSKMLNPTPWERFDKKVLESRVLICPEEEGGFSAHALRLPGVVSQGETVEEALSNIEEAFRGTVCAYREAGEEIPWESVDIDRPAGSLERWILVDV